ncbi:hypothetical protein PEBR_07950 [Penicillium brasilianum]|uniref:HTH CENPB-type domain-containing protein n=1 Tax=Penicillium brasilianum TaxID=104259 RepID=A0A1S9RVI9_PENBI|nr:hypothetical protein PEBR_07950 [Penicillium brasilianum]
MPPIRTESSHKLANQEGRILLALSDLKDGRAKSLRAAAKLYEIPFATLQARADGRVSRVDKRPSGHKLTQTEEDALTEWIISMDSRGAAPRPATVGEMANILLAARGSNPPPTVGVNWPSSFIKRRDELRSRFSRRYDYQRALDEDPKSIRQWFATIQSVINENVVKRAYGRFVSDLARRGYNHIDKHDFLVDYQHARLEAFQSTNPTIKNSFAASGLVPLDAERVLNKLNISLRTPTPPNTRPSSRSSEFTSQTPRTATQLFKQASMLKDLLKRRSNSPPSPSKEILDQMIKGFQLALHSSALLAEDNANLRMANEKIVKKRNRSTKKIPCEEGFTIEEAI